ncbi:MAG: protein-L-isoaspartate(D-aspartate) O-methyltransferase [Bacteroidetes bacterium]|nr:protein-L-isoaspartate(D-aspartate) O-methyltransferase [Bacteroidota bacterium]MDA1121547.1 protein-L-isoaspartate(D-aspartate) O-methyltransferase [Bacteroidota bacterium]
MIDSYKHRGLRRSLVNKLKGKGIDDAIVLEALGRVPRHFFFSPEFLGHAYQDKAFPIGEGQTISQPYTVAFQTMLLQIKKGDKVLEIGTGSGYQCCILMELGADVYTIEYNKSLFQKAKSFLIKMGYNAQFFMGDGSKGLKTFSPYDAILVTAGAPTVPKSLIEQLKPGGRLVIPVGNDKSQKMIRIEKTMDGKFTKEEFANFSFVPLVGEFGWKSSK